MKAINFKYFTLIFFMLGLVSLMSAFYIPAKAQLAQYLLEQSWNESQLNKSKIKPWPWADMYPVARMKIPSINMDIIVLFGSSGETLAFAPGHIGESVLPGNKGNSLISAHKDTHFQNLDKLQTGDAIFIERVDGKSFKFLVTNKNIVHTQKDKISLISEQAKLALITCYPLKGAYSNPDKRFVVSANYAEEI